MSGAHIELVPDDSASGGWIETSRNRPTQGQTAKTPFLARFRITPQATTVVNDASILRPAP